MKRIILIISILIISLSTLVSADNIFPIEEGETILDSRDISDTTREIFTELEGEYYRKTLEREDGIWTLIKEEKAELPLTGLIEERNIKKDYSVEKALEDKLKANGYNLNALPSQLDLSNEGYLPPVGQQFEDSCVGWATGYYLRTYQQAKDIGWEVGNNPKHIFSPSFIYNQINEGVDEGATLQDAGDLLKDIGAATLDDFPYIPRDYLTQPSQDVIQKAEIHRIRDWKVIYTSNDSKEYIINKTKEYLNTGDLPVVGINVGFKWAYPTIQPDGTSMVTTEQYTSGGHAVVVVGYDDNMETPEGYGAFKIVNSYGTEWGQDGYTYMTYNALASAMRSGFIYTDLVNGRIVGEIDKVNARLLDENTVKFTWNNVLNASGYKVLDERYKVIANVYSGEYKEELNGKTNIKRYFQAFNSFSTSNVVEAGINLNNIVEEIVAVEIEDTVDFQINFSGSGRYDIRIKDSSDNIVKEDLNKLGKPGINIYTWDGKDDLEDIVSHGDYKLELTPYKGTEAQTPFILAFEKKTKAEAASAKKHKLNDSIYKVEVNITAKEDGKVSIYIISGDTKKLIVSDDTILQGENKVYNIDASKVDLNDEKMNILVEIQ